MIFFMECCYLDRNPARLQPSGRSGLNDYLHVTTSSARTPILEVSPPRARCVCQLGLDTDEAKCWT
nr:MAG TPA: hypothetical protein [Caudoviricetes sp.]